MYYLIIIIILLNRYNHS